MLVQEFFLVLLTGTIMSRHPNPVPPKLLNLSLPEDIHATLTLHLYSDLEGRVPHGAYSKFFVERIRSFFSTRELDLAPWANIEEGAAIISGPPETIALLRQLLRGEIK